MFNDYNNNKKQKQESKLSSQAGSNAARGSVFGDMSVE